MTMRATKQGSKGDGTKQKILRGAMKCLAQNGDRGTTFQSIADYCGVSQPLVVHYFQSRDSIFTSVLENIVKEARSVTMKRLEKCHSAKEKLSQYLRVSLEIFRSDPEAAAIYVMLYHFSTFDTNLKRINSEIKTMAVNRLGDIITEGIVNGEFEKNMDVSLIAKTIHNSLVGLLLNVGTEFSSFTDRQLIKGLEEFVFRMLSTRPPQ